MWLVLLVVRFFTWRWLIGILGFAVSVWNALPTFIKQLILCLVIAGAVYLYGDYHGRQVVQERWDQAKAEAVQVGAEIGAKANAEAEQSVPQLTPQDHSADTAVVPRVPPCRVRDQFDRSCSGH